jgi:hypothetical protein
MFAFAETSEISVEFKNPNFFKKDNDRYPRVIVKDVLTKFSMDFHLSLCFLNLCEKQNTNFVQSKSVNGHE